ncbi:type 1 glutamine amidotransferase domain-containing protein [Stenomitos frigidus]|uniref:Protease n=1 Tax=Stenomitos frigidus ULC18 TaxID=2107698 RepID=A0A2T1E2K2_9CYAN|nr:type 1 glutamine amidotransferase domain-containing protein [Stenomitos frigidus]PSB26979.1 protease [Stenomitos frigidus ULC18]
MTQSLNHIKIAILVADGFEQVEMTGPKQALDEAGAQTQIISPNNDTVQGWNHFDKGDHFPVNVTLDSANPDDYDALLLPGGVANPDQLRINEKAVRFVKSFFAAGKPVAAICHAPWTLIEAAVVNGRNLTSWPSLQTDLKNAGANWVDQDVVVDNGLVTSRKPQDIPAFNRAIVAAFATGRQQEQPLSTVS